MFSKCSHYTLLFTTLAFVHQALAARILIDPGHGGVDKGAMQASTSEADIAWAWSLELKKILTDRKIEVELSRNETRGLSLTKRIHRLKQKKYDLIVSVHANYILDPRAKGVEYFVATPLDLEDQKLQLAHEEIQLQKEFKGKDPAILESLNEEQKSQVTAIVNDLGRQAHLDKSLKIATLLNAAWPGKLKQGPFDLLSQAESPALLIELGFLSNPADFQNLINPQFRLEKSLKIAEVLSQYFRTESSAHSAR